MGLDITAYKGATLVEVFPDTSNVYDVFEDKYPWDGDGQFDLIPHFREYADRISPQVFGGVYQWEDSFGFRAGSYSGYNRWRNQLSLAMLGVSAETVWSNEEHYKHQPFYHLINFSDCEGVIGTDLCKRLAKDFADYQSKADQVEDEDGWFRLKYADWRKAFEMASDSGYLKFH